jgi:hypothetical protein
MSSKRAAEEPLDAPLAPTIRDAASLAEKVIASKAARRALKEDRHRDQIAAIRKWMAETLDTMFVHLDCLCAQEDNWDVNKSKLMFAAEASVQFEPAHWVDEDVACHCIPLLLQKLTEKYGPRGYLLSIQFVEHCPEKVMDQYDFEVTIAAPIP